MKRPPVSEPEKLIAIHLDLKGKMFRPSYIPQLFRDLAGQGVNTVVVEYEDIFPFKDINVVWDPAVAWTPRTLKRFLAEAKRNGIEVIPLQQCLGHLEYVFRWHRYRRFAEDRAYPSTLCLSKQKGRNLVANMLRQVVEAHPDSRYVHIGMDEARGLASCPRCAAKGDVLALFLQHLRDLCDIAEEYGKTPILWSDMLEDHFRADVLDEFRDRVIMCPWDYSSTREPLKNIRLAGWRASKHWIKEPDNPQAPALAPGQQFMEDLPADLKRLTRKLRHGPREFNSLFQADLWTQLGFRAIGATAIRISADREVLPDYDKRFANIRAWGDAISRNDQLGLIGTSWARGTTFCPPNFSIDLTWPGVRVLAQSMGKRPRPFWPGVPAREIDLIVRQLARCQKDWQIEDSLIERMTKLAPKIRAHRYEWNSMLLMARVMRWQKRAAFNQLEVDAFAADCRLVEPEWQRRIDTQRDLLAEAKPLRKDVHEHFGKRYHGQAFDEWIENMIGRYERTLKQNQAVCRASLKKARKLYAK